MSMPVSQVRCSTCDFIASSSVIWGLFKYELSDKTQLDVEREYGWCHDCKTLVPIEKLTPLDSGEDKLEASKKELAKMKSRLTARLGWRKLELARLTSNVAYHEKNMREIASYNNLVESRVGTPRCLKCSKRDVLKFNFHESEHGQTLSTGFVHPECGGELVIVDGGLRFAVSFPEVRIYDPEGVFVRSDPNSRK